MLHIKRGNFFIIMVLAMILVLVGCKGEVEPNEESKPIDSQQKTGKKPLVTMTLKDGGVVEMELYPDIAPNTVNNFISLVEDDFYDGLLFHRVMAGFMIQGGDPDGVGTGGPGYGIKGEFSANGVANDLSHQEGVLSMARSQDPDSAGSQFFIVTGKADHLDGEYAAFGKVIEGMDIVKEIEAVETDSNDKPVEDQVIESMTVELKGYEAEEPVKE